MKGFVMLAIVLLVPSMAYFNKQHFEREMQPGLQAAAVEVMRAAGVEEPVVRMDYLDATLLGRVDSEEARMEVAAKVDALRGVRVRVAGNQLEPLGWLRIERREGEMRAEGVVPPEFVIQLPLGMTGPEGWDREVRRRASVEAPTGATGWNEFLEDYFRAPGERSVELRRGGLEMRGDATVGFRADWLAKASGVVDKERVSEQFELYPSVYHFPGYEPSSLGDQEGLERVRRELLGVRVVFEPGSAEIPASEVAKVAKAANAILTAGDKGRYLVGGHPGSGGHATGNGKLAKERAAAVIALLIEDGVSPGQLEVVPFGAVRGDEWDHRVEILVK